MSPASAEPQPVSGRAVPIELGQFIKFGGLTASGGEAKQAIGEGRGLLNGTVETPKRKNLAVGDRVTFNGRTLGVRLA